MKSRMRAARVVRNARRAIKDGRVLPSWRWSVRRADRRKRKDIPAVGVS